MVLCGQTVDKKGFTLVELLVVIAVITLLLSLLLPSLGTAKVATRQVVCAAQMKQWALATLAYTGESNNTVPPYADTCDWINSGHALDIDTFWYNRLGPYLTRESYGSWGMGYRVRRCPMARADWGDNAVWVGVYYSLFAPELAPFVFLNEWYGSVITKKCRPFKANTIRTPASYLMLLDVKRDRVHDAVQWPWNTDDDGDGMNDSHSGVLAALGPYNYAKPKIHRGGCNVALFDGHVEWIRYDVFWEIGGDGYPMHRYWWNQNRS